MNIIESEFVEYSTFSTPVLIDSKGNITFSEKVLHLEKIQDLNGLNDGSRVPVLVEGDTMYTSKRGAFIGRGGSSIKLLSKYLGNITVKGAK